MRETVISYAHLKRVEVRILEYQLASQAIEPVTAREFPLKWTHPGQLIRNSANLSAAYSLHRTLVGETARHLRQVEAALGVLLDACEDALDGAR